MSESGQSFGLTSWDEVEIKQNNSFQKSKDVYMRLDNGSNVVRCVTRPHQYYVHTFKEEGDSGWGEKIMCSFPTHKACPLCEQKDRPKRRWLLGVIDRKTNAYKILDIGVSVFKAIQELSRDEVWGDPMKYDIDIKVDKQGGATGYYTVIPKPPRPLSAADVELKNQNADLEDLQKRCTPPTPDKVRERMENSRNKKGNKAQKQTVTAADHSSGDEEMTFPMVAQ